MKKNCFEKNQPKKQNLGVGHVNRVRGILKIYIIIKLSGREKRTKLETLL